MSWVTDEMAKRQSADTCKEAEALKKAKELIAAEAAIAALASYIRTENDHLPALIRMTAGAHETVGVKLSTLIGKDNISHKSRIIFYPHKLTIPSRWNNHTTAFVEVYYQSNPKGYLIEYDQEDYHFTKVVDDVRPLANAIVQAVVTGAVEPLLKLVRS